MSFIRAQSDRYRDPSKKKDGRVQLWRGMAGVRTSLTWYYARVYILLHNPSANTQQKNAMAALYNYYAVANAYANPTR